LVMALILEKNSRLIPGPRASPATALFEPGHEAARAR
jgi:hypothetical protein